MSRLAKVVSTTVHVSFDAVIESQILQTNYLLIFLAVAFPADNGLAIMKIEKILMQPVRDVVGLATVDVKRWSWMCPVLRLTALVAPRYWRQLVGFRSCKSLSGNIEREHQSADVNKAALQSELGIESAFVTAVPSRHEIERTALARIAASKSCRASAYPFL